METVLRKVDVKERLPELYRGESAMCHVLINGTDKRSAFYIEKEDQWISSNYNTQLKNVTHWYEEIELSSLGGEEKTLDLGQLFKNNSDCYADTRQTTYDEEVPEEIEGPVIQAMTEERFIEVVSKLAAPSKKGEQNMEEDLGKR